MATLHLLGKRGGHGRLAEIVTAANPGAETQSTGDGLVIYGRRLEITRAMVEQAFWPKGAPYQRNVTRMWRSLLLRGGPLQSLTEEKIVFGDAPIADRTYLLRLSPELKAQIEEYAKKIKVSQNDFILLALRDFIEFLHEEEKEKD